MSRKGARIPGGHEIREGQELQRMLIGSHPLRHFDPNHAYNDPIDTRIWNNRDINRALAEAHSQIDVAEAKAKTANPSDRTARQWENITTSPKTIWASALLKEFCSLLGLNELQSKKIRFYGCLDTVADRMGADFFLEIDPSVLMEDKFGKLNLKYPLLVTGDVTLNEEKEKNKSYRADVGLFYQNLPLNEAEQQTLGQIAGAKMALGLIKVIKEKVFLVQTSYEPPIEHVIKEEIAALSKPKHVEKREIEKISGTVVKRVRKVDKRTDVSSE